jgi:hypothetical protein
MCSSDGEGTWHDSCSEIVRTHGTLDVAVRGTNVQSMTDLEYPTFQPGPQGEPGDDAPAAQSPGRAQKNGSQRKTTPHSEEN